MILSDKTLIKMLEKMNKKEILLKRKLWLSILTGQLFDITAFCINRKNSVSRFVRLQGGTMVYYIDDELIKIAFEINKSLSELNTMVCVDFLKI